MKYRFCTLDWLLRPVMFFYQSHLTLTFQSDNSIQKYIPYCYLSDQVVSFELTRFQARKYAVK